MAPQIRRRATAFAVLAAGPALAVGALAAGPARAETAAMETVSTESGKQVVFDGGGLLGVSCAARPDVRSITVPAETSVRVVNRTGYSARLLLDGAVQGEIPDAGSAQVLFRRGPVTLKLKPSCVLSESSKAVRVHVEAAPPAPAEPEPAPAAPLPDAPAATPDADPSPSAPGSMPDGGQAGPGSVRAGNAGPGLPGEAPRRQRAAGAGLPDGGLSGRSGAVAVRPGAGGAAGRVVVPGMPPGEDPLLVPEAPAVDLPPAADTPVGAAAAEPVAALDPVTETGPTGLLAIVATVCAAGVTTGLIRAIAAQRANRARTV
jgi:hypothetical protein